eukprot:11222576-Lingulodinium_polyedra.AAC.1
MVRSDGSRLSQMLLPLAYECYCSFVSLLILLLQMGPAQLLLISVAIDIALATDVCFAIPVALSMGTN